MSSFYGNIKFNNQTPLIFDKIYGSRYEMEQNCQSDGIFNGRFILISYGEEKYTPYYKLGRMTVSEFTNRFDSGQVLYVTATGDGANAEGFKQVKDKNEYYYDNVYYIKTDDHKDDSVSSEYGKNKATDEINYHHDYHNTVWQKIWTSTQDSQGITEKYIMISHLNAETPKITLIVDAPNDAVEIPATDSIEYFPVPTDQHGSNSPGIISREDFNNNKNVLFIKQDNEFLSVVEKNLSWDIGTIYYTNIDGIYRKFPDSNPYVDGLISEALYKDLLERTTLYVVKNGQYKAINPNDTTIKWEKETKYYMARLREHAGRPHFDPIMSTDLDYRFHIPRNWKFDNTPNFVYNHEGFAPEKASDTGRKENNIVITEQTSSDFYPLHRKDEPGSGLYKLENNELVLQKALLPDTKKFNIDLSMLGDAVSKMWNTVYPKYNPDLEDSERNMFIGNDRDPENPIDYPGTLAEAVRKLYYWLGIKDDNNFIQGPYRTNPDDPSSEVNTIFGVLNGATTLLGDFNDVFNINSFIPVAGPYYPLTNEDYPEGGFGHRITDDGYHQLSLEEFETLHNGGAGRLYKNVGENQYELVTDFDYNTQYYRNMNSLFAMLRAWQDTVRNNQADWVYDEGHREWNELNPMSPRFIHNKPAVLLVDQSDNPNEASINWFWKNYAT